MKLTVANLLVIYYSAFGHVFQMAQAVANGASQSGAHQVKIVRIPEMAAPQNRVIQPEKEKPASSNGLSNQFRLTDRYSKYEAAGVLQENIPYANNDDLRWADGILWGFLRTMARCQLKSSCF